jgi:hypothetical protein
LFTSQFKKKRHCYFAHNVLTEVFIVSITGKHLHKGFYIN